MRSTKGYLEARLTEVEKMLSWSARVAENVTLDNILQHADERYELLKERAYLLDVIYHNRTLQ